MTMTGYSSKVLTKNRQRDSGWMRKKIHATANRDRGAFRDLYVGTCGSLFTLALGIVRDRARAEDVLQDGFVEIWTSADRYDPNLGQPFAWMAGIVRFRALDRIRKEDRQSKGIEHPTQEPHYDLLDLRRNRTGLENDLTKLVSCIEPLGENQQQGILLAYYYGYSHRQIAQKLNCPIGSVKPWIRNGLASVSECMGR